MNPELKQLMANITDLKNSVVSNETMASNMEAINATFDEIKSAVEKLQLTPRGTVTDAKSKYFDGQKAARLFKCDVMASKKGESRSIHEIAQEIYGKRDPDFVEEIKQVMDERIQQKALMASGNAGVLIEEAYFSEVIPLLYNKLAIMNLGATVIPMPNGNINVRKMVSGSTAQYIGESQPIRGSQPRFGKLRLSAKKLSVKVPYSNDLLRSDSVSADRIILNDMVMQLKLAMDYAAFYGEGTEYTPLGIKNTEGITTTMQPTTDLDGDAMYRDFVQPLKVANIPMESVGWAFPPQVFTSLYNERFDSGPYKYRDELLRGTFHGYMYEETNQIEFNSTGNVADIFFGDFAQFFCGEQVALEVKTSEDASYLDQDGNTQNAFDNDETVIRGIMTHDMGLVYGKAFVFGQRRVTQ